MPNSSPDMDLLALAGMTKAGLRDLDQNSMGSNSHADKIDMDAMAGVNRQPRRTQSPMPNLIDNRNFIEMPKSRPMGQVSFDGEPLPDRPIDFARVPADIQENVDHLLAHVKQPEVAPVGVPSPPVQNVQTPTPDMDFDLFQFTILKEIIGNLDVSIKTIEDTLNGLKNRRCEIMKLVTGDNNEKPAE